MNHEKIQHSLEDLLSGIRRHLGSSQEEQIRDWLMAATLRIWAGNKLCAEDYVKALSINFKFPQ